MAFTIHPHLGQRLKKELSYTSTPTLWAFIDCCRVKFFLVVVMGLASHTLSARTILKCILDYWKICAPLLYTIKFKHVIKEFVNHSFLFLDYTSANTSKFSCQSDLKQSH